MNKETQNLIILSITLITALFIISNIFVQCLSLIVYAVLVAINFIE